jgi:hypothetical protein
LMTIANELLVRGVGGWSGGKPWTCLYIVESIYSVSALRQQHSYTQPSEQV